MKRVPLPLHSFWQEGDLEEMKTWTQELGLGVVWVSERWATCCPHWVLGKMANVGFH